MAYLYAIKTTENTAEAKRWETYGWILWEQAFVTTKVLVILKRNQIQATPTNHGSRTLCFSPTSIHQAFMRTTNEPATTKKQATSCSAGIILTKAMLHCEWEAKHEINRHFNEDITPLRERFDRVYFKKRCNAVLWF